MNPSSAHRALKRGGQWGKRISCLTEPPLTPSQKSQLLRQNLHNTYITFISCYFQNKITYLIKLPTFYESGNHFITYNLRHNKTISAQYLSTLQ